ncbi:MAG: hypothetical protein ACKVS6_05900 [Planctomycetota bacterium]
MLQFHRLTIPSLANLTLGITSIATLAAGAHAQNVHVVDDSGGSGILFTQIQPAVTAAVDGDIILVKPGTYNQFTIQNKTLIITSDVAGGVLVDKGMKIMNLAASRSVTIRGMNTFGGEVQPGLTCENNNGPIWIENCELSGNWLISPSFSDYTVHSGVSLDNCISVAFLNCKLIGGNFDTKPETQGGMGLNVINSDAVLYNSDCIGGKGGNGYDFVDNKGGHGGHGAVFSGGSLFASGSNFTGGKGGDSQWNDDMDPKWPGGDGGHGLFLNNNNPTAFIVDCTFAGGAVGANGGPYFGPQPAPGLPTKIATGTIQYSNEAARTYSASSPVRENNNSVLTINCNPGEFVSILYSYGQDEETLIPAYSGDLLLTAHFSRELPLGHVPTGNATFTFKMNNLPPTVQGRVLYTQSLFTNTAMTYPVIGPASAITILDNSY